jgi:hypothetical protein
MPIHNSCKYAKHDSEVLDTDNGKVILETYSHFSSPDKREALYNFLNLLIVGTVNC